MNDSVRFRKFVTGHFSHYYYFIYLQPVEVSVKNHPKKMTASVTIEGGTWLIILNANILVKLCTL